VIRPQGHRSRLDHLFARLEILLYAGGWPFRVARALGVQPEVTTTRYDIPILNPPGSLRPLRVAFASDFHAGPTTNPALLHAACDALQGAAPDVLLLGGDFVSVVPSEVEWLAAELGRIPAPFGRFAVLGNHDWCSDAPYVIRSLEREGIQVLINQNVRLPEPFDQVWICGLDDHGYGNPDPTGAVAGAAGIRIVLMHAPSGLLDLGQERFELALCGHTHGGQIALPSGAPIITPHGRLSRQYPRGRFELSNNRTLIVSVGLGCVVLPLRFFANPQIVLCDVRVG
jgi:predicted MPP superfamily phosphohydrolase